MVEVGNYGPVVFLDDELKSQQGYYDDDHQECVYEWGESDCPPEQADKYGNHDCEKNDYKCMLNLAVVYLGASPQISGFEYVHLEHQDIQRIQSLQTEKYIRENPELSYQLDIRN